MGYVYKIENTINNRVYIGQTTNFKHRISEHKYDLRHKRHSNIELQNDFDLYGINAFRFDIIIECENKELLNMETKYIKYYGGIENYKVYNRCDLSGHNLVYKQNQAKAQLGVHKITEQGKVRISKANKNKIISEQQIDKIRHAAKHNPNYGMKNKKHSEYSKQLMSDQKKGKYIGSDNPNFKYTDEFIQLLRKEYAICKNYTELGRRYNINRSTISSLIRFNHC